MTPRTTFLLPVRDGAATLDAAIRSVRAQTDRDLELLVVDDGSGDASAAIAQAHARHDPRVRVLRLPPTGLVDALQAGLAQARGRLVARMDADDLCLPDRLAHQVPALEADPRLGVVDGRVTLFREDGEVPEGMRRYAAWLDALREPSDFDRELLVESPLVHPAVLYRRADVLALGGYREGPFPEDYDLWLRMHAAGWRFRRVPHPVLRMRDRPDRLTRTDPRYGKEAFRRVRQAWLKATLLAAPRRVALWGAGKEGGRWLRWLLSEGHRVPVVIDVAPRRIGSTRLGVPVAAPEALPTLQADLLLVAVAARGAREEIRADLARLRPDWSEGRDWWALR